MMNNNEIKKFLKEKKIGVSFFGFLTGEVFLFLLNDHRFFEKTYVSIVNKPIKNVYVLASMLLIFFIVWLLGSCYKTIIEKNRYLTGLLNEQKAQLENTINEYTQKKEESEEKTIRLNELMKEMNSEEHKKEGNRLVFMAMALDTFEPGRIKLLSDAAEKHHNLFIIPESL